MDIKIVDLDTNKNAGTSKKKDAKTSKKKNENKAKKKNTAYLLTGIPQQIQLSTASQWRVYNLLEGDECKVRAGNSADGISWDAIFFGAARNEQKYPNYLNSGTTLTPKEWVSLFQKWRDNNTHLKIVISEFGINMKVQIDNFVVDIGEGSAFGDIHYSVSFFEYNDLKIKKDKKSKGKKKNNNDDRRKKNGSTYTVIKGDTLWRISLKYYGSGSKYTKIYNANKEKIEKTAKKYHYKNSDHGHWIFPGTKLTIP